MKKILLLLSCICLCSEISAESISFINSNETEYKGSVVTCRGNVVAVYNKKIISANEISFDEKNDQIKAKGNVIIKDEFGNTYFADSIQVLNNFKSGHITNLKIISKDKTRLAASQASVVNEEYLLENVIFTPCYKCTNSGALTWQLKSNSVTFNPKSYTKYEGAVIEAFNVPIFYVPYLSHVSSNIKRKSGFLVPKISYTSQQGISFLIPYLFSISDSQELIFKPIVTSRIGHVPWIYYGWRFPNGKFSIDASLTGIKSVDKNDLNRHVEKIERSGYRGHVFAKLCYEIDNNWRTGFDINLASDRYYLKRFSFFDDPPRTLESRIYLEGFNGRNYTMVRSAMYQSEYMDAAPKLLPMIEHNHYFQLFGGTLNFRTAFMNLDFKNDRMSQKYICNPSWYKEILLPNGHILEVNAVLAMQGLNVKEEDKSDYDSYFQVMPQLNLTWKWPLFVKTPIHNLIFTPVMGISIARNHKRFDAFEKPFDEINESNMFSNSKSISSYNVDSGRRLFYGFHANGYYESKNIYYLALGESFELTEPLDRVESSGLMHKRSNLVGVLDVFFNSNLSFSSNGSYSRKRNRFDKIEVGLNYTNEKFDADIMWFKGKQNSYNPFIPQKDQKSKDDCEKKYKGFMFNTSYKISPRAQLVYGIVFGNQVEDIPDSKQIHDNNLKLLKHQIGLQFENECVKAFIQYEKENKRGADLRPETTFKFIIKLKKLG